MTSLLQTSPADDRVYQFLDKKRSEGKPYLVYMTAGANKFLRICYGKVKPIGWIVYGLRIMVSTTGTTS